MKPWRWSIVIAVVVATVLAVVPASAQSTDDPLRGLQRDVEALRRGQLKLELELREIKDLLRARGGTAPSLAAARGLVLPLEGRVVKGAAAARVVIVDFTDYQ